MNLDKGTPAVAQIANGRTEAAPTSSWALGQADLTLEDLYDLATYKKSVTLAPEAERRMQASAELAKRLHEQGEAIYGVTTSVGASVDTHVPKEDAADLSLNVLRMHGCGTGQMLSELETAAVVVTRVASLSQGKSGVRPVLATRLLELMGARVLPRIPCEGSVGASGDLTPLSYLAATLVGEREVSMEGRERSAKDALSSLGLEPLRLLPKEALALMNGTAVATALACLCWKRTERLARLTSTLTAMASVATKGNPQHFDAFIHANKPHVGQIKAASWIRDDLRGAPSVGEPQRLQDRYSVRCTPQILGVLVDALSWSKGMLETELNGVSDNPIVDVEGGRILHGGNFYGGHVGFVCDSLKAALANIACLLDRQIMLICNPDENGGLPANLVGVSGPKACTHNGFKAVTIAASALSAEAMKLSMPASAFSRSTELHNQDKVPMATMGARDLRRTVELTEQVAAMAVLACCQAYDLRGTLAEGCEGNTGALHRSVRAMVPPLEGDRRMDLDIQQVLSRLHQDQLPIPACAWDA